MVVVTGLSTLTPNLDLFVFRSDNLTKDRFEGFTPRNEAQSNWHELKLKLRDAWSSKPS